MLGAVPQGFDYNPSMFQLGVLNVGHGLCVVNNCHHQSFVYDCGDLGKRQQPLSWQRLRDYSGPRGLISAVAVSHLHRDHYQGLLSPLPNYRADLKLILGRFPTINNNPVLTQDFVMRLITISSPESGPRDFDLIYSLQQSAPNLKTAWVYRGCTFRSACQTWTVKWPPTEINLGHSRFTALKGAIDAYDKAAAKIPWLKDRLDRIQENSLFRAWESSREKRDGDADEHAEYVLDSDDKYVLHSHEREDSDRSEDEAGDELETSGDDGASANDLTDEQRSLLSDANTKMGTAANDMSMVLVSDSGVLLTGDATPPVMKHALGSGSHHFAVVVTPHHGGKKYVPDAVRRGDLTSDVWATSTSKRYSRNVSLIYDRYPGHFRTDRDCCAILHCNINVLFSGSPRIRSE